MPTVMRVGRYRLFFFANEGAEPRHVHVEAGGAYAKLWLEPVAFADARGLNVKEMNEVRRLVLRHKQQCVEAWDEFFSRKH
jgi:hypothetical protein